MYRDILRTTKVAVEKATSLGLIALLAMLSFMVAPSGASAADFDTESTSQSDPTVSQTGNVFTLTLGNVTATTIRCINIDFTTTVGGSTLPTGMGITPALITPSGTIVSGLGTWTETNPNAYTYRLTDATGAASAGGDGLTIVLTGVTNGSTPDTAFFTEVNTFSDNTCATAVDTDGIATFVFTEGVTVSATVNPTLTFTVDLTTCNLGTLSASSTGSCSHTMTAASNATSGYSISYIASATLTSPALDTIDDNGGTALANAINDEQFGLNLVANTTPTVGANPSGGSGAAAANYGTANSFAFNTAGATVATTTGPSATTTFTVSYIANIDSATEAGLYTKTQTYNITATY